MNYSDTANTSTSTIGPIVFRTGKRVYLRPVIEDDLSKLVVWINDPDITEFLMASVPFTLADERKWYENLSNRKDDISLAIVLKETHEIIGMTGIHDIKYRDGTATTGSFIGRKDLWSQGFGTEAKLILLEYAFNTLNLRKICSQVYDFNGRSKKHLENCGYKEEARRKQHIFRSGKYCDEILLAVYRSDFERAWKRAKVSRTKLK